MKKMVLLAFVLVLLSVSMFGTQLVMPVGGSTIYHVYPGQSIQDAINSAQSGDTIFVHSGTYHEHVIVNKTVSLTGENRQSTIIRGDRVNNVIDVAAENVDIARFTITDSGPSQAGIIIIKSGSNITGNEIFNNYFGVTISSLADENVLESNLIHSNGYSGIHILKSNNNTFRNNDVYSNYLGIVAYDTTSNNNIFVANNIYSNSEDGISIKGSNNIVVGNTVFLNVDCGIVIFEKSPSAYPTYSNIIKDNNVSSNGRGISVYESDSNTIKGNKISNNGDGIRLSNSENNSVFNNTLSNNGQGIDIRSCTNTNITKNRILENNEGLHIEGSRNNILVANTILNNSKGVELEDYSDENIFINNTLSNNNVAVTLSNAMYNDIFHNNFIDNAQQVSSSDSQNTWDDGYPSGGNYWNDYGELDTDGDGIGDTPYVIDANNQDRYPLVVPLGPIPIVWDEMIYSVELKSNSTISRFRFNASQKMISFNVTGLDDTLGFCNLTIPKSLIQDLWQSNYTVLVDGKEPLTMNNWTDGTYTYIYFTYLHSEHKVEIIPEFPTWTSILLILIVLTVTIAIYKRRLPKTPIH